MTRILVTGSRIWGVVPPDPTPQQILTARDQEHAVVHELKKYVPVLDSWTDDLSLVHGMARGLDTLAGRVALMLGFEVLEFPAQWDKYHRAAGPIRNQQMLDEGTPDFAIAFHQDLSRSKGTADMVRRCKKDGVPVKIITRCECPDHWPHRPINGKDGHSFMDVHRGYSTLRNRSLAHVRQARRSILEGAKGHFIYRIDPERFVLSVWERTEL